ncbi:hypothetical protein [Streptomyces tendae]
MILGLCREFHCLPSALYEEDVKLIRMAVIERMGTNREERGMEGFEE